MANTLTGGFGLRPIGKTGGNPNNNATTMHEIANNYTTAIYNGGIVIPLAGGTIAITDQAVAPLGVLGGVEYVDSVTGKTTHLNYWPGSNAVSVNTNFPVKAYVYDDPYTVFKVQSAGTPAQTNIGNCADVVAGTGSTITGQSGFELSGTMSNGTATCKILGLYEGPENAFGTNAIMEVLINEHLLKDSAGI